MFSLRLFSLLWITLACSTVEASNLCEKALHGEAGEIIRLTQMGYKPEIAERMIKNQEPVVPHILANQKSVPVLNEIMVDFARYRREYNLATFRKPKGLEPITLYRGIPLREAQQKIDLSLNIHLKQDYVTTGNVAWVSPDYSETTHYAIYRSKYPQIVAGYVLKLQIPANLLFQKEEWCEGFLHPKQVNTLDSFLVGAYELRVTPPGYQNGEEVPSSIEKTWIPYEQLPKKTFQK